MRCDQLTTGASLWLLRLGLAGGGLLAWILGWKAGRWWVLGGAVFVAGHLVRSALQDLDVSGRLRISRHLPDRPWIGLLDTWTHQAVVRRDPTMARRLDEAFVEDLELEEVLAVVGKAHVPGMRRCLASEHGWTERTWRRASPADGPFPIRRGGVLR